MRNILRERDVYVPKGRNVLISDALYAIVKEELDWTSRENHDDGRTTTGTPIQKSSNETLIQETAVATAANQLIRKAGYLGNLFKAYSGDSEK